MNHDEFTGVNCKDKETFGLVMLKVMFYILLSVMLGVLKLWKKSLVLE